LAFEMPVLTLIAEQPVELHDAAIVLVFTVRVNRISFVNLRRGGGQGIPGREGDAVVLAGAPR
jgi:hypothetical protein